MEISRTCFFLIIENIATRIAFVEFSEKNLFWLCTFQVKWKAKKLPNTCRVFHNSYICETEINSDAEIKRFLLLQCNILAFLHFWQFLAKFSIFFKALWWNEMFYKDICRNMIWGNLFTYKWYQTRQNLWTKHTYIQTYRKGEGSNFKISRDIIYNRPHNLPL